MKTLGAITIAAICAMTVVASPALSAKKRSKPPIPFTKEMMVDADRIEAGKEVWHAQCTHCHGAKAYPGKAPKLKPAKYKPNFVYRRVTDGFRKMPAWDEVFTDEERMNTVIYIMSDKFSP